MRIGEHMIILFILAFVFFFFMTLTVYYMVKYANPYQLIFVFGKKGVGKSTFLCKIAYQYRKRKWTVYSTEKLPFSRRFDPSNFGTFAFPPDSVILIDEVSLIWSNRDFKNFQKNVERQFRLQRHDRLRIYLFSQTYDVDVKIRSLADSMFLAVKLFNCITVLKKVDKSVVLTKSDSAAASRIAEDLRFEPFILAPFGSRIFVWIPRWARYFDSFDQFNDQRAAMPYEEYSPVTSEEQLSVAEVSEEQSLEI